MALFRYNAKAVVANLGPVPIIGWADGQFINVALNEDTFALTMGTDGFGCRSTTNNYSGRITFTLGQWSPSNAGLKVLWLADRASMGNAPVWPFKMVDGNTGALVVAAHAWVIKPADQGFERDPTSREWIIESENIVMTPGVSVPLVP